MTDQQLDQQTSQANLTCLSDRLMALALPLAPGPNLAYDNGHTDCEFPLSGILCMCIQSLTLLLVKTKI